MSTRKVVSNMDDLMAAMQAGLDGTGPTRISLDRAPREEGPQPAPVVPEEPRRIQTPASVQLRQDAADIRLAAHHADDRKSFLEDMARAHRLIAKAERIERQAAEGEA